MKTQSKNNAVIALVIIGLLLAGAIAGALISNNTFKPEPIPKAELVTYFSETISTKFISSIGQPRDGITPPMFLDLFPNLREQDLDGVQTALGKYEYKNGQLNYVSIGPQTHSAAQTITQEGYETLLNNLADRFNIELNNKNSVDKIIEKLYGESQKSNMVQFRTISKSNYGLLSEKTEKVIKAQGAWVNFWSSISQTDGPIPQIDFNDKMVIAVTQGQKGTSGYSIEITKITEKDNEIIVEIKEKTPGYCAADQVLTSPYHIVEVKKSNKPVRFNYTTEVQTCGPVVTTG